jgi:hypothetical protein
VLVLSGRVRGGRPLDAALPGACRVSADPWAVRYQDQRGQDTAPLAPFAISAQLDAVHQTFARWFGADYDLAALDAVLAAAAAERLGGDPPWLQVVGGSGAAKTETVMALAGAGAVVVSSLTGEAALLSGTSAKERAKDAHGGLLRRVGDRGVLVVKDFTSVLSMSRDSRAEVLAALREVYDGRWERYVGTDGGQTLTWAGRVVVVGAVTSAWDAAHSVVAAMGDRFVLVRFSSKDNRAAAGRRALANVGHESAMRTELAAMVGELLGKVDEGADVPLTEDETETVLALADLVTLARTAVARDQQGEPAFAHEPEMPTRFAKQLAQLARGALALGMARVDALALAVRCAGDSMPPLRLRVLCDVAGNPDTSTSDAAKRLQLPRRTVDRTLQELHLLGLLVLDQAGTRWIYRLGGEVSTVALAKLRRNGEGGQGP